jgi:hypothetical protein
MGLWSANLETGSSENIVAGMEVTGYDISPDGKRVAYEAPDSNGKPHLWIAALDRMSAARQLEGYQADNPCFAADGTLFFRGLENGLNFVYRMDGGWTPRKAITQPVVALHDCSADGNWLIIAMKPSPEVSRSGFSVYNLRDNHAYALCLNCWPIWPRSERFLYVAFANESEHSETDTTYAIDLRGRLAIPKIPPGGITAANIKLLPVVKTIEANQGRFYPGNDLNTYALAKETTQQNIYRIPIR